MNKITLVRLIIFLILVIVPGISASASTDIIQDTNTKAEQHFEKANELLKRADYEAAIAEYEKVINIWLGSIQGNTSKNVRDKITDSCR